MFDSDANQQDTVFIHLKQLAQTQVLNAGANRSADGNRFAVCQDLRT